MTATHPLSLFISSKMQELTEERRAAQKALAQYHMQGWLWEHDAGARPETIRQTYLKAVEECDLYLGLFWLGYGPYTIEEFDSLNNLALLYSNQGNDEQAEPLLRRTLAIFEQQLGNEHPTTQTVRENYAGLLQEMGRRQE